MAFGTDESVLFREVSLIQGVLIESICITHELEGKEEIVCYSGVQYIHVHTIRLLFLLMWCSTYTYYMLTVCFEYSLHVWL